MAESMLDCMTGIGGGHACAAPGVRGGDWSGPGLPS